MTATLHGENNDPVVNKNWTYQVEAVNSSGCAETGSVLTQFTYQGVVEGQESPPTHPLAGGVLTDQITFPPEAIAHGIALQVVVTTPDGKVTLNWPVTAKL
ncbi:MAG TPA: hypothetical protein VG223_16560 [Solirubrobacteraceae bacterium]|jgi:hypothetical protein|nr:hypothetical protein [Solirubrobacteraceae bacterium]